jgi:hypothetical protein
LVEKTAEVATALDPKNQGQPFVFVATYLPLRSWMNVVTFIRLSGKVEAQLLASQGAIRLLSKDRHTSQALLDPFCLEQAGGHGALLKVGASSHCDEELL